MIRATETETETENQTEKLTLTGSTSQYNGFQEETATYMAFGTLFITLSSR